MSVFDAVRKYILTGATDDAVAAGEIFPAAGVYQSTVDEVDDGDIGRVRISKQREMVTISDITEVTIASNVAASSYGIASQYYGLSGSYKTVVFEIWTDVIGLDQAMTVNISSIKLGLVGDVFSQTGALPSGAYQKLFLHPQAKTGTISGNATWYQVFALQNCLLPLRLNWSFPVAATQGLVSITAYLQK